MRMEMTRKYTLAMRLNLRRGGNVASHDWTCRQRQSLSDFAKRLAVPQHTAGAHTYTYIHPHMITTNTYCSNSERGRKLRQLYLVVAMRLLPNCGFDVANAAVRGFGGGGAAAASPEIRFAELGADVGGAPRMRT